jgi:putative acetyltransferase
VGGGRSPVKLRLEPRIEVLDPGCAAGRELISLSDAYLEALYPAESNHLESIEALQRANVLFLGCFVGLDVVGCGAAKTLDDDGVYGEVKRVFVVEAHRGRGYSKAIMHRLEESLRSSGIGVARLETGIRQPEALGLYRKLGYVERAPFGGYAADPLSLFFEKKLFP